jgi:multisubunit Na+/H+ antiporter MnhC subunit
VNVRRGVFLGMNKKTILVIIGITIILSTFVLFAKVNAKENGSFAISQSDYFQKTVLQLNPLSQVSQLF